VLIARFRERVASAKKLGNKISISDEKLFLKQLSQKSYVPGGTPLFDTSLMASEQIAS